jgi:hypothetical protein
MTKPLGPKFSQKQLDPPITTLGMIRQVLLSCFPAVVPLLIMRGQKNSRRAFSTMLPAKLFGVGWHWACVTDANEPIVAILILHSNRRSWFSQLVDSHTILLAVQE